MASLVGSRTSTAATPPPTPARPGTAPASRPSVELPSADEIRAAYDAGRFDEVLRKLRLVLSLNGAAGDAYDRHALLRLRGETLLRIGSGQQAAASFAEAAREAPDPAARATDRATGLLLRRTAAGATFQPRTRADGRGRPSPVDVVSPDGRKAALRALFVDELAARRPTIEAAAASDVRSLDRLAPAVAALLDLCALEVAGTDDLSQTSDLAAGLDAKVAGLLKTQVEATAQRVLDVQQEATKVRSADGFYITGQKFAQHDDHQSDPVGGRYRARPADRQVGLGRGRAAALREAVAACEATVLWCDACEAAFKGGAADFRTLREQAEASGRTAQALLGHDWSTVQVRLRRFDQLDY